MSQVHSSPSLRTVALCSFLALAGAAACGSSDASSTQPPAAGGAGGTAQDGGSGGGDGGSAPDAGGTGGSSAEGGSAGATGGAAGSATGGSGGGANDPFANPAFSGIDTSVVPAGVAPSGCEGGLDASSGELTITLSYGGIALIGVVASEIQANGVVCTTAAGDHATPDNTSKITVSGADGAETLIIDLSTGSFGPKVLSASGGIHVDLGAGDDSVMIRHTEAADDTRAGKSGAQVAIGLSAASAGDIWLTGVERLVASLGPGADTFMAGQDSGFDGALDIPVSVYGDADDDTIEGGAADDLLNGGAGDDTFDEGDSPNGADTINGGSDPGNTVTYARRTQGLLVTMCLSASSDGCSSPDCTCGADDGGPNEHDNIVNVHHLIGGSGGDDITGTLEDDVIEGGEGADYLYGQDGADTLLGGDGDDTLDSGSDSNVDTLDCGGGDADIAVAAPNDTVVSCELY